MTSAPPYLPCKNCRHMGKDHEGVKCLFSPTEFETPEKCRKTYPCNSAAMQIDAFGDYYYCDCPAGQLAQELEPLYDHIRNIDGIIP